MSLNLFYTYGHYIMLVCVYRKKNLIKTKDTEKQRVNLRYQHIQSITYLHHFSTTYSHGHILDFVITKSCPVRAICHLIVQQDSFSFSGWKDGFPQMYRG